MIGASRAALAVIVGGVIVAAVPQQGGEIPLPPTTGPHRIALVRATWTDSSRLDSLTGAESPRSVKVSIWYPSAQPGSVASYATDLAPSAGELGAVYGRVRPTAGDGGPFASALPTAPVIVLAPGRIAAAFDYSALAEELASHGFVVLGVDSPGHSKIFRDGALLPVTFGSMPATSYPNGFDELQEPMNGLVGADLRFAIGRLAWLNQSHPTLRGRLNLGAVGMLGHSNGAMAGSRACSKEVLCKAFLGIEGSQTREIRYGGNQKPFGLVYGSQTLAFDSLGVFTAMRFRGRAPFVLYRVEGAGHNSFNDLLLVRPQLFSYPMNPGRSVVITREIVRSFFDAHLLGKPARDPDLPEVVVERYAAGRAPVEASLFGRGVFSTGEYELPPTFAPDGGVAYFTVSTPQYGRHRWIMESRRTASGWSPPRMAWFSGRYDDADPYFSPDGNRLFFLSKRPIAPGQPPKRDLDIWVMHRGSSGWGAPQHLGPAVNGPADEHYVTSTSDGRLIIAAVREDSRNQGDLYEVSYENGQYGTPRNLGSVANGADTHETTPWVAPDGRYIIFGARGRRDSYGDTDLYITVRDSLTGAWGTPVNLGPHVNSRAVEYCPLVSPDGEFLYFTSTRSFFDNGLLEPIRADSLAVRLREPGNGLGDTYRIPMREVLSHIRGK